MPSVSLSPTVVSSPGTFSLSTGVRSSRALSLMRVSVEAALRPWPSTTTSGYRPAFMFGVISSSMLFEICSSTSMSGCEASYALMTCVYMSRP